MPAIEELFKLLDESGCKVTFDMYRDNTKGCGDHCRGWNPRQTTYCPNHMKAILNGDYLVAGGSIEKGINRLREKAYPGSELVARAKRLLKDPKATYYHEQSKSVISLLIEEVESRYGKS